MKDKDKDKKEPITPSESLASLPPVEFQPDEAGTEREFAQAELLKSVLLIAQLDHVSESRLVRDAVKAVLGQVPKIGE
jgi:hypothetical protein